MGEDFRFRPVFWVSWDGATPVATTSKQTQCCAGPGAYGRRLGERFGADDAPHIVTRTLQRAEIAVTEVRIDQPFGAGGGAV